MVTDVGDGKKVVGKAPSSFVGVSVGEEGRNRDAEDDDEVRPSNLWVRCWYRWLLFVMFFFFFFFFCFVRIVVNGGAVSVCGCRFCRWTRMSSVVMVLPHDVNDSAIQALLLWLLAVALLVVLRMRSIIPVVMFLQRMVMMLRMFYDHVLLLVIL